MESILALQGSDKDIVDEFYRWSCGVCKTNFHAQLFSLICKADSGNQFLLSKGYPLEVQLIMNYKSIEGWFEKFTEQYKITRGLSNGNNKTKSE